MPVTKKRNHFLYPGLHPCGQSDGLGPAQTVPWAAPPAQVSIYVGVPYCRVRCYECPFFSAYQPSSPRRQKEYNDYFGAVRAHIKTAAANIDLIGVSAAVYVGGGTATIVAPEYVQDVVETIKNQGIDIVELTIEGNPEDISDAYVDKIVRAGATRISLGLQSNDDEILRVIGSPHKSSDIRTALDIVSGIRELAINIDLMYGVPFQTPDGIASMLAWALEKNAESVTWYPYSFQPEGILPGVRRTRSSVADAVTLSVEGSYAHIRQNMINAGYNEQMIGAYCKLGCGLMYSDLAYRLAGPIIGVGARSYTYDGAAIYQCPSDPQTYSRTVRGDIGFPYATRSSGQLTEEQTLVRRTILGLLYAEISQETLKAWRRSENEASFAQILSGWKTAERIVMIDGRLGLTEYGAVTVDEMLEQLWRIDK